MRSETENKRATKLGQVTRNRQSGACIDQFVAVIRIVILIVIILRIVITR
jgi:hypothetical protein